MKILNLLTLGLSVLTISTSVFAITPEAQQLIDFEQMVGKQKSDWFNWMGKTAKEKYDLLAKEHDKWFKFETDNMKKFDAANLKDALATEKAQLMKEKLKNAVALYEENKNEMKTFWKNVSDEAKKMCDEQDAQLQKFKVSVGLAVETPKEGMKEKAPMEKMMEKMPMGMMGK